MFNPTEEAIRQLDEFKEMLSVGEATLSHSSYHEDTNVIQKDKLLQLNITLVTKGDGGSNG